MNGDSIFKGFLTAITKLFEIKFMGLYLLFFFGEKLKKNALLLAFSAISLSSYSADIVISFCPVTKTQASPKGWSSTFSVQNNSGVVLDLASNKFTMDWPSLVSLPWPFSNGVQVGTVWSFNINVNWPGSIANGQTANLSVNNSIFSGVLQFPTSGTYLQGGKSYTVEVKNCNQTQNFELFDATFDFKRECFLYSPTKLCLGQAATEIWNGEGVFDAMFPTDRPSWAIANMVGHRLFTNLAGADMISPNFWTATAMNESRMTCDPTIVPNKTGGHTYINANANSGVPGAGISNTTNNCFQILNIGYKQIEDNQPDLFAQTNAYGTAGFSNVIDNGNWETGAIAVAYYHYQDIRYWDQIYCFNIPKTWKDAKDPYAIEKIFYHAYHDGPNAGITLLNAIRANYTNAVNATNMNTVIGTGGTWGAADGGSSQKVGNFTSLLDGGNAALYAAHYNAKSNKTTQNHGCYNAPIKWTDILYYLDKIKILYPKLQTAAKQAAIKAVFDGINGGATVNFEDLGPVIDEIVIQMGGHDPSKYIATQFSASKTCPTNALGVSLRTNDTICPGTTGELQVWLSGDKNFKFTLKYPDGSSKVFSNVDHSPFIVPITQPGDYEVVTFEDNDEVGNPNCLFSKLTVQSKNGTNVNWDKSGVTGTGAAKCTNGPLVIKKSGAEAVTVTYKKDGGANQVVNIAANATSHTIVGATSGQYIITTISPNSCGTPVNDTIKICSSCVKPKATITGTASICQGDSTQLSVALSGGTGPYKLKFSNGATQWTVQNVAGPTYTFYAKNAGTYKVDSVWNSTCDTLGSGSAVIAINTLPTASISGSTSVCVGDSAELSVALTGTAPYTLKINDGSTVKTVSGIAASPYKFFVKTAATYTIDSVLDASCKNTGTGSATLTNKPTPTLVISGDTSICAGETAQISLALSGTAPFSVTATVLGVPVNFNTSLTSYVLPLTAAGLYTIDVTDGGGCKVSKKVNIIVNTPPVLQLGSDQTVCFGNSTTLDAGAGMSSYAWTGVKTGAGRTIVADATGQYKVVITDANGCKSADSLTVTVNPKVDVAFASDTITICPGGSINLSATTTGGTNPYTHQWSGLASGTNPTFSANTAGWHKLTVADSKLCAGKDSVYIKIDNNLTVNLSNKTICEGDSVTLDCGYDAANYTILWSTSATSQTINVKTAATYTVHVENGGGCSGDGTMDLTLFTQPIVSLGADKDVCAGTTTLLDAGAVFSSYKWNTLENTKTVTKGAGTYNIEVVDANGCKDYDTITVNSIAKPTPNVITDVTTCLNTNVTFDVSSYDNGKGPFTYKWNDNSTGSTLVLNGVTANSTHWVDVTDKYGCTGRDTAKVIIQAGLSVVLSGAPDTTVCAGQAVTLNSNFTAAGGYNFNWSTGETAESIVVNSTKNITLTVDDGNGCNGQDLIRLKVNPLPNISLVPTVASVCSGDAVTIGYDYGAGYTYQWAPDGTTPKISVNTANTYSVTVTNTATGCKADTDVVVTINAKPLVSLRSDLDTCAGITVTLQNNTPQAGVNYNWTKASTGNTSIAVTPTLQITANDTYTLTVTDPLTTCVNSDVMTALFRAMPSVDLLSGLDTSIICEGQVQTLDAGNTGMTYLWFPSNEKTQTITKSTSGLYAVEVSNGICKDTDAVYLRVITLPTDALSDTLKANKANYCFAEELAGVDISAVGEDLLMYNYLWAPGGETTQSINVKQAGTYSVTVSLDKCAVSDQLSIIDYCPTSIFVPQAFTPNGDNKNEVFKVVGANAKDFELLVFNRWGEQIFSSTDINQGWDGTCRGDKVQIDVYVWKLTYSENLDTGKTKKHLRMGTVALVE